MIPDALHGSAMGWRGGRRNQMSPKKQRRPRQAAGGASGVRPSRHLPQQLVWADSQPQVGSQHIRRAKNFFRKPPRCFRRPQDDSQQLLDCWQHSAFGAAQHSAFGAGQQAGAAGLQHGAAGAGAQGACSAIATHRGFRTHTSTSLHTGTRLQTVVAHISVTVYGTLTHTVYGTCRQVVYGTHFWTVWVVIVHTVVGTHFVQV